MIGVQGIVKEQTALYISGRLIEPDLDHYLPAARGF